MDEFENTLGEELLAKEQELADVNEQYGNILVKYKECYNELDSLTQLVRELIMECKGNDALGTYITSPSIGLLEKLEQAVTPANKDSKLDKKTVINNLLKCDSPLD